MIKKTVQDINEYIGTIVNPLNTPDTMYELYSVPSFDSAYPEVLLGSEIGSSKVTVEENDVLVCKINPRINRVWIVKHNTEHQLIASSEWVIIRSPKNDARYLCYYFQSPTFRTYINSGLTGIGGSLTRAQPKQIAKYPVPIPDSDTQQSIADKLDKLHSIITHRKQQIAKLDELVKARFVEMFGDVDLTPQKSEWTTVSEIGTVVGGSTPKTSIEEYWDGDLKWITPAELNLDTGYLYDSIRKITKAGAESCSLQLMPINTVILTSRAPIGKVAIAGTEFYCNQGFKNIICKDTINPRYLYSLLLFNTDYLNSLGRGATFKEISKAIVEKIRIPIPQIELQNQFADFVKQVDKSKVAVQKALDEAQLLFDSLMQEYFG